MDPDTSPKRSRLLAVSNRLPVVLCRRNGTWQVSPGSGGLVTAMAPALRHRGGVWIGWPGVALPDQPEQAEALCRAVRDASDQSGYRLEPVMLSAEQVQGFYYGFANEILWPLLHGFETRCNFDPDYWQSYTAANRAFAEVIARHAGPGDFIWIHDYHLMRVAAELRRLGLKQRIGFFLHTPFPPPDVFFKLPWRAQLLDDLLAFDLVGFHTMRDRRNFTRCLKGVGVRTRSVRGRGAVVVVDHGDRTIRVGAFPISLDFQGIRDRAKSREIAERAWLFHERFPERPIIIGIDRLDYTKGIPERLDAFELALKRYPELRENVNLVQLTVPSRENVPEYEQLRGRIEQQVGDINGRYTQPGWVPVHYMQRSFDRDDVLAMLRAAEIALVTPLRDGMNLVAKEFCACDVDHRGVLVLSEFAGAADELHRGALVVNPYDVEQVASAIHQAFNMPPEERKRRMQRMTSAIRRQTIFHWVDSVLQAAAGRVLSDFPVVAEYEPDLRLDDRGASATDG